MSDRFKFRAWDVDDKKMIIDIDSIVYESQCIDICTYDDYSGDYIEIGCTEGCSSNNKIILMQCIGIKDKNDKLIFEGDLIKAYSNIYEIRYDKDYYALCFIQESPLFIFNSRESFRSIELDCTENGDPLYEVIGNIYENPELLKDKEINE